MKILITGGAGCLGSNLIEHWLPKGHEILVIDNFATGRREVLPPVDGLTVHEGSRRCASGEMGVQPRAIVWCVDAEATEAPLAVLTHPKGARAVICVGFNAD